MDNKDAPIEADLTRSSSDEERALTQEQDKIVTSHGVLDDPDVGLTDEEKAKADRKLLWKLDLRLIPWLCLLYLVSFLDRTNIGNAKIYGLNLDLQESSSQYAAALSLFFVSYSLLEPLTNVLLKLCRPRYFLMVTVTMWGVCMTLMGTVHNFSGLAAVRFFLGVFEAGLFPGVNYYLSCYYKRNEFGIRAAIFFSAAALAGSFGGLLAAAIHNMDGIGGRPGWAWIFILEGLFTVIVGLLCYWMVQDFPDEARFLTEQERARLIKRLKDDKQASSDSEKFDMKYFWQAVKDWKTWAFAIVYCGCDGPLYAFSLFTPSILRELGYTNTRANLLSVPPYAAAAVVTVAIGFVADRTKQRGLCNIGIAIVGVVGFIMLLATQNPNVKYAGVYLGAMGIYPCIANTIAWCSNNIEGVYKRGVTLGIVIGWGNLNGVVSSNIYRDKDQPEYYVGHGVVLAYLFLFLLCGSILTRFGLQWENRQRRAGKRDHWVEGKSEDEVRTMGDQRPDFLYTR